MATTCELIASQTLGANATSVTFSGIPQTFDDLVLTVSARSDRASIAKDDTEIEFNGSSSNLSVRGLQGNGSSASSFNITGTLLGPLVPGSTATANTFGSGEVYIPNYAGSSNKSVSVSSVHETNATQAFMYALAGLWASTAAITSILLRPQNGTNFVTGSSFYLYGITKA